MDDDDALVRAAFRLLDSSSSSKEEPVAVKVEEGVPPPPPSNRIRFAERITAAAAAATATVIITTSTSFKEWRFVSAYQSYRSVMGTTTPLGPPIDHSCSSTCPWVAIDEFYFCNSGGVHICSAAKCDHATRTPSSKLCSLTGNQFELVMDYAQNDQSKQTDTSLFKLTKKRSRKRDMWDVPLCEPPAAQKRMRMILADAGAGGRASRRLTKHRGKDEDAFRHTAEGTRIIRAAFAYSKTATVAPDDFIKHATDLFCKLWVLMAKSRLFGTQKLAYSFDHHCCHILWKMDIGFSLRGKVIIPKNDFVRVHLPEPGVIEKILDVRHRRVTVSMNHFIRCLDDIATNGALAAYR